MTRYGRSPWLDAFPRSHVRAHPRQRGAMRADAVIVGGGLTGCLTSYALAAAGASVVLLEADRVGCGATAFSSGWIAGEPGVAFADLEEALGVRAARLAWRAWRRAALDFISLLRRLDITCRLEERGSAVVAATPEQAARLKREARARRDGGVDAPALNARAIKGELALDVVAGLRSTHGATLDPYRACVGVAAAAADRGALLFERSPVRKTTFTRKDATVLTAAGSIRTRRVIVATAMPTALFKALARHFWFRTAYLVLTDPVPAKVRRQIGLARSEGASRLRPPAKPARGGDAGRHAGCAPSRAVVRDAADPPHTIRWIDNERLLITGAEGEAVPPRRRDRVVVQRTGQLMYELSTLYPDVSGVLPAYGWAADYARTAEGLPYIGAHRNYPHHLFAFGDSSPSVTGAYLASRVLLRHHLEEGDPADAAFAFTRHGR